MYKSLLDVSLHVQNCSILYVQAVSFRIKMSVDSHGKLEVKEHILLAVI